MKQRIQILKRALTAIAVAHLVFIGAFFFFPLLAQEKGPGLLREIAGSMESYRGKSLTMALRLKNVDPVFERISFYDRKNHDIIFDISARKKKKELRHYMKDLHEGMLYRVIFTVTDLGKNGLVLGDLKSFVPVVLEYIPGS